jgi:hypothetical protein
MIHYVPALCAVLLAAQPGDKTKPPVPAPALVLIWDHVGGFSLGDKAATLRLQPPPKGDVQADAIHIDVPLELMPKDAGGKVHVPGRQLIAVYGRLSVGKVVVGQTGAKLIYAANLHVAAAKVEVLSDKEAKQWPAPGKAEVRGKLLAGKFQVKEGETAAWAIENAEWPIVLVGKGAEQAKDLSGAVVASGRLRLVRPGNVLVLEVEEIAADKLGAK